MNRPNILLITIDSLRAKNLSLYGYRRETSPHLEVLASEGVVFENAFTAANWTGASIASILTGLYPTSHGYTNKRYYLDADVESIATILQHNGYRTVCFSNNLYITPETGLTQGFTEYYYRGVLKSNARGEKKEKKSQPGLFTKLKNKLPMRTRFLAKDVFDSFNKTKALTRDDGAHATEIAFKQWISSSNDDPFFAYIHYQEPHSVYFPPLPYRRRFFDGSWLESLKYLEFDHIGYYGGKRQFTKLEIERYQQLYDGEIAYLDWRLGRLFDFLRQIKMMDNTLIIITADHGECMGEKGYIWHAFCLYDPLIRVPLVIRYPDWFPKGQQIKELVQTIDFVPTILEGLGIEWRYKSENQGMSFLNERKRDAVLTETFNPEMMVRRWLNRHNDLSINDFQQYLRDLRAYRTLKHKLIWASDGWHEFYDLTNDPDELENIYDSGDVRVKEYLAALKQWSESLTPHVADSTQPGFDKDTWEKMKALGYA